MKNASLLAVSLVLGTPWAVSAQQPAAGVPARPQALSGTAAVRAMPLSETLKQISQDCKVAVIADAYAGEDAPIPTSEWKGLPPAEAIGRIAKRCERDVSVIEGIYVLRHKRWAAILAQSSRPEYSQQWRTEGTVTVTRLDKPDTSPFLLPSHHVEIAANGVSCSRFVSELRQAAACEVSVVPEIGGRRLHVYAKDVAPASVLSGVAFVLNAGPEVVLRPSQGQKAMEEDARNLMPDFLKRRIGPSDALRADLEKGLTDDQRQALASGQYVPLSVSSLPADLQARALDYIKLAASLNSDLIPSPDFSRQDGFQVRFRPDGTGEMSHMLGVVTMDSNGNEYYF